MALPGNKNFSDYDNYITDPNPTTSAQAQDYFRNQAELLKAVIDCDFWQPETVYQPGDVVKSDGMPNGTEAVMVATKASVTSNVEPEWGAVGGGNISDGTCFWKLQYQAANTIEKLRPIATYSSFSQLGLTQKTATMEELVATLPAYSMLVFFAAASSTSSNYFGAAPVPTSGIAVIIKSINNSVPVQFTLVGQSADAPMYYGRYTTYNNLGFSGWGKVARLSDIPAIATKSQAEAGTDNATVMTPLQVANVMTETKTKITTLEETMTAKANVNALSMPSGNKITLATDLTRYTAPADGWLCAKAIHNGYVGILTLLGTVGATAGGQSASGDTFRAFIPVAEGETVAINTINLTMSELYFVYAKSSEVQNENIL